MRTFTRKNEVKAELALCLKQLEKENLNKFIEELNYRLLQMKVKQEYCASEIFNTSLDDAQIAMGDKIAELKTEGGNVLLGILLQKRLSHHFHVPVTKAAQYIAAADEWYVPDIIGERVFG